jgi:hypothetical protein
MELAKKQLRITACDLCEQRGPFIRLTAVEREPHEMLRQIGIDQALHTELCPRCGWIFKPLVFDTEQISNLYALVGGKNTLDGIHTKNTEERARRIFDRIVRYSSGDGTGKIVLDIGGGAGQASLGFAQHGSTVHVVDVAAGPLLHRNMIGHHVPLQDFKLGVSADIAIMAHILEHVWSPTLVLSQVSAFLADQGLIYIEVPFELYTPLVLRKTGDVAHVGYFTRSTLREFLGKAGFEIFFVRFMLESYGSRKVVTICAIGQRRPRSHLITKGSTHRHGWTRPLYDLLSAKQILMTIASRL